MHIPLAFKLSISVSISGINSLRSLDSACQERPSRAPLLIPESSGSALVIPPSTVRFSFSRAPQSVLPSTPESQVFNDRVVASLLFALLDSRFPPATRYPPNPASLVAGSECLKGSTWRPQMARSRTRMTELF